MTFTNIISLSFCEHCSVLPLWKLPVSVWYTEFVRNLLFVYHMKCIKCIHKGNITSVTYHFSIC